MQENTVCLSIQSYNQIKAENTKFNMFLSRMMESSVLAEDEASITFDVNLLTEIIHLIYPEAYKKRLSYLRGQDTREAMKAIKEG